VNVARVLLHPDGLAPQIVNRPEWTWHVLDRMRERLRAGPDARLARRLDELERLAGGRPPAPGPGYVGFAVPLRLRAHGGELALLTTLTEFGTTVDVALSELRLEAFLPGDAETARRLADAV
jgi:hypothetical protein